MKLYTISEVAERAGVSINHVKSCLKWNILGSQKLAGVYICNQDQLDAWLQDKTPPRDQPVLHTVKTASETLGISTRQIRQAAERGDLPHLKIKTPGRTGWSYVFRETDLVISKIDPVRPGPKPKGNADAHIMSVGDRYVVKGTHNRKGIPYSYKRLSVARRRAREAYDGGLVAKAGEQVNINWSLFEVESALVLENVTNIDQTVIVSIKGQRHIVAKHRLKKD